MEISIMLMLCSFSLPFCTWWISKRSRTSCTYSATFSIVVHEQEKKKKNYQTILKTEMTTVFLPLPKHTSISAVQTPLRKFNLF